MPCPHCRQDFSAWHDKDEAGFAQARDYFSTPSTDLSRMGLRHVSKCQYEQPSPQDNIPAAAKGGEVETPLIEDSNIKLPEVFLGTRGLTSLQMIASLSILVLLLLMTTLSQSTNKQEILPPIVTIGMPILTETAALVKINDIFTEDFQAKLVTLKLKMQEEVGAGIAAPQIGWNASVFVVGIDRAHPDYIDGKSGAFQLDHLDMQYWINPRYTWMSDRQVYSWEGCMSVPGMRGWVKRPADVTIEGYDHHGVLRSANFTGAVSRLIQHEAAHLFGSLFPAEVDNQNMLVSKASFPTQELWIKNWPSPGAQKTPPGQFSDEF